MRQRLFVKIEIRGHLLIAKRGGLSIDPAITSSARGDAIHAYFMETQYRNPSEQRHSLHLKKKLACVAEACVVAHSGDLWCDRTQAGTTQISKHGQSSVPSGQCCRYVNALPFVYRKENVYSSRRHLGL